MQTEVNISYSANFIQYFLAKFIHYRNMLLHYQSSIKEFRNLFESVCIDINFSENLTLPVKHQAQSLHWSCTKVTVHSGIIKADGEKIYHIHLSENPKHNQTFMKISIA